jgi:hypothetical protein
MAVMMEQMLQIEDPRNHSVETQDRLRYLLTSGAPARPDEKRADFFEIEDHNQTFYVHVSKTTGSVTLLAVWNRNHEHETARSAAVQVV